GGASTGDGAGAASTGDGAGAASTGGAAASTGEPGGAEQELPLQTQRYIKLCNKTDEKLTVYVQLCTIEDEKEVWLPASPEDSTDCLTYELEAGQETSLE